MADGDTMIVATTAFGRASTSRTSASCSTPTPPTPSTPITRSWAAPAGTAAAAAALEEDRRRVEQSRVEMLRGYAETDARRREPLLTYFGEPFEPPCGACDNCEAGPAADPGRPPTSRRSRSTPRSGTGPGAPGRVLRYDGDRMVVLFDRAGYRTLSIATVLERRLLRTR